MKSIQQQSSPGGAPALIVDRRQFDRRQILAGGLGLVGAAMLTSRGIAAVPAPPLRATPAQTAGPFYPETKPADSDADLFVVAGHSNTARGTPTLIGGRVFDPSGSPIVGALVEIWQCDAFGRYHHPLDGGGADPGFQGFGRTETSADGRYRFRTIRPVAYGSRTPHIHFRVRAPGLPSLTTQMYVEGEPRNEKDFVLAAIRDPAARSHVIVPLAAAPSGSGAALAGAFDIVLTG